MGATNLMRFVSKSWIMGVEFLHPFVSLLTAFKTTIERTLLGFYKVQTIVQVLPIDTKRI